MIDTRTLASELLAGYTGREHNMTPPSSLDPSFDVSAAYETEAEFKRLRELAGHGAVGRKVGYANKAMWRVLKLETLVWAHMYDDTLCYEASNNAELTVAQFGSPRIEPEIVFKLKSPLSGALDAAEALEAVDWMAIGFEIIDCPFTNWEFKPVDFVAAYGLHKALVVGQTSPLETALIAGLVNDLASFKIKLLKNDQMVEEGSGRNSLRSPALCLAELARTAPLAAGELISTGTLTAAQPIASGEVWRVEVDGLPLPDLTLRLN